MNVIVQILTVFCAASIFIGALYIICPTGEMNKSIKYVLSLAFLLTVVTAAGITIKSNDFDLKIPETDFSQSDKLDVAAAEYVYSYALNAAGINFSKITVCTDNSEDGSIVISKVIICSDCEKTRILQALGEAAMNFEVEIINE